MTGGTRGLRGEGGGVQYLKMEERVNRRSSGMPLRCVGCYVDARESLCVKIRKRQRCSPEMWAVGVEPTAHFNTACV